jgi:hypothetical protein
VPTIHTTQLKQAAARDIDGDLKPSFMETALAITMSLFISTATDNKLGLTTRPG